MKSLQIVTVLIALAASGCTDVRGNGVIVTEVREVPTFDAIGNSLPINVDVEVVPGAAPSLTLRCDENVLPHIVTALDGTMLRFQAADFVSLTPTSCFATVRTARLVEVAGSASGMVVVHGELPELRALRSSGSGGIDVLDSITSPQLAIAQSGSGNVVVAGYEGDALDIDTSGSGGVEVNGGRATEAEIESSGSGGAAALDVVTEHAVVRSSSSGGIAITATQSIDVALSSSGSVIVGGSPPDRDIRVSGSGRVVFR
jgi:hypothetical protein